MYSDSDAVSLNELGFSAGVKFVFATILKTIILFGAFYSLLFLKNIFCNPENEFTYLMFAVGVLCACTAYFIFYIISEGILKQMFIGFIISVIGVIIAAIFPPFGIVLAIVGIISMIKQIISFAKMIPLLLLGALICALLFSFEILSFLDIFEINNLNLLTPVFMYKIGSMEVTVHYHDLPYYILTFIVSLNLSFKYSLKNALFRMSIIFLSIPIMIIIFYIVKSMLNRAVTKPNEIQQASISKGKIWVNSYPRADGTMVAGHWRGRPF